MNTIIVKLTPDQCAAKDELVALNPSEDLSKLIRRLLSEECQRHNIVFPDNMPKPSRKRKAVRK